MAFSSFRRMFFSPHQVSEWGSRLRIAIASGQIGPGNAGLGEVADGVEKEPVVDRDAAVLADLSGSKWAMRCQ